MPDKARAITADVLLVGGGIAGLTTALALLRAGIAVTILEQASRVGDVGAGISLGSGASRALYSLGLRDALAAASDRVTSSAALHYQSGGRLGGAFVRRNWDAQAMADTHMIHRADLFALLNDALHEIDPDALRLHHRVVAIEQDGDGVTAFLEDGSTARGGVLIGCDGARSRIRGQLFGDTPSRRTGQIAYRFLVPTAAVRSEIGDDLSNIYVGPGCSLLYYPIRKQQLLNCVALVASDAWTSEGWSQRVDKAELAALFAGWHPVARALAQAAPDDGTAKWALIDRDPLPCWSSGRATLLGDAAHPMLPHLGMGAAMGIEDAIVIGRVFAKYGATPQSFARYEGARRERANTMLLQSRHQSEVFRDGPQSSKASGYEALASIAYDAQTVAI